MLGRAHRCQHDPSGPDIRERSSYDRNTKINQQGRLSLIGDEDLAPIAGWQFEGQLQQLVALQNSFGLAL
jgi:hypothetical protein